MLLLSQRLHLVGAFAAMLLLAGLWLTTAGAAVLADEAALVSLTHAVTYGFFALFPVVVLTGTTGQIAAGPRRPPRIKAKRDRMPFIGAPCLFLLAPSGFFADRLASGGDFGFAFQALRALQLVAGAVALGLMILSARDGFALTLPKRRAIRARARREAQEAPAVAVQGES